MSEDGEDLAVLDTNVFGTGANLGSPLWVSLKRLCSEHGILLCIPDVVLRESVNLRRDQYHEARKDFLDANNRISKFYDLPGVYVPDPDEVAADWQNDLTSMFRILQGAPDDALEALEREASRTPPARGGRGARDSLIWLTVLRSATPGVTVHFVSRNTRDFGTNNGDALHSDLAEETRDVAGEVQYHSSLDSLFDALAVRVDGPDLSDPEEFTPLVAFELWDYAAEYFADCAGQREGFFTSSLQLSNLRSLRAYRVDERGLALVSGQCIITEWDDAGQDRSVEIKFMAWVQFDLDTKAATGAEVETVARVRAP